MPHIIFGKDVYERYLQCFKPGKFEYVMYNHFVYYPADEGVKYACSMLHNRYLSEVSGVHRSRITQCYTH